MFRPPKERSQRMTTCWRGLWRGKPVVSREKHTISCGMVAVRRSGGFAGRETEGKMANVTRGGFDLGSGGMAGMPSLRVAGRKILWIAAAIVIFFLLMASITSIPTGNVGVLTLFGRVTGETLPEGIHLINPLNAVQNLSIPTHSLKDIPSAPSTHGLILSFV